MKVAFAACSGEIPPDRSSVSEGVYPCLHLGQFTRTRRCAMMAITEDAIKNGCTPMSPNV